MSLDERRDAWNEADFRAFNERVRAVSYADALGDQLLSFVCECSDLNCFERVHVQLSVYDSVRARSRHFLIRRGHQGPVEEVVRRGDGFMIVEKQGIAGRIADVADPNT